MALALSVTAAGDIKVAPFSICIFEPAPEIAHVEEVVMVRGVVPQLPEP